MSRFWRFPGAHTLLRKSLCKTSFKSTLASLSHPHIYKKIWTEDELVQHLRNNIVYESDDNFITSLPVGVGITRDNKWCDSEMSRTSDVVLTDLAEKLNPDLPKGYCYVVTCPRRNASGLTLFAKSGKARTYLRNNFKLSASKGIYVFGYLAVVIGQPDPVLIKDFAIQRIQTNAGLRVQIKDISLPHKKASKVSYKHEVLASTDHVSLVKAEVSRIYNDSVRHILADRCFTPVLGDSWSINMKQAFMFGVPLVRDMNVKNTESYALPVEVLEKLQLEPGEEKHIPPHIHMYSLKLPLKKKRVLSACVPPPDYFIWTCNQLGLHGVEEFIQTELEQSKMERREKSTQICQNKMPDAQDLKSEFLAK